METTRQPNAPHPHPAPTGFVARLKQETAPMHAAIEKESFFFRMGRGEITKAEYIAYMQCQWRFTRVLEARLATQNDAINTAAKTVGFPLSVLLEQDLKHYGAKVDLNGQLDALFAAVRADVEKDRTRLLGYVYLIGGSQHGASFMAKSLQKTGIVNEKFEGAAYLRGEGLAPLAERWPAFVGQLQTMATDNLPFQDTVIGAVRNGYGVMHEMSKRIAAMTQNH